MREMDVLGVRVSIPENEVVVVLADRVGPIVLPIVIGPREGASIASAQAGIVPQRPQTHDLLVAVLAATGVRLDEVHVTSLESGTFHAELLLSNGHRVDARPSDAIALALRVHCPVLCEEDVLTAAGVAMETDDDGEVVEQFRHFLEHVDPADFAD
ncbi:bifunctional nuclease family protein [Georgenia faecalis]|uniref:Bifunctional nuclease family protein n=1 Tax=Georgenia faecalis TaxID=2483799 RepID=A0ABV9D9M5_9MICO|nr:bifunctional nuclease family protein [Georgenia faecalis]